MGSSAEKTVREMGDEFYLLMGNCISAWASIEHYLFKVCRTALGATTQRAAIVYSRTPTIEGRRQLVYELLETVLPMKDPPNGGHHHPDMKEWLELNSSIIDLLRVRNRIAHQPMGPRMQLEPESERDLWFEIYSSEHEAARKGQSAPGLRKEDLEKHAIAAWELKERLASFYVKTLSKYARHLP